jgi:hypothetical protein
MDESPSIHEGDLMSTSNAIKEKRKHPRFNMDLPLDYRMTDSPHVSGALVVNASKSGLLMHSIKGLPIGTKLNIAVMFPDGFKLANFEVLAEIVWTDIHWEANWEGYHFGLKFVHIREEDHRKLKQLLDDGNEK